MGFYFLHLAKARSTIKDQRSTVMANLVTAIPAAGKSKSKRPKRLGGQESPQSGR
jgi:hypothetical protein